MQLEVIGQAKARVEKTFEHDKWNLIARSLAADNPTQKYHPRVIQQLFKQAGKKAAPGVLSSAAPVGPGSDGRDGTPSDQANGDHVEQDNADVDDHLGDDGEVHED